MVLRPFVGPSRYVVVTVLLHAIQEIQLSLAKGSSDAPKSIKGHSRSLEMSRGEMARVMAINQSNVRAMCSLANRGRG